MMTFPSIRSRIDGASGLSPSHQEKTVSARSASDDRRLSITLHEKRCIAELSKIRDSLQASKANSSVEEICAALHANRFFCPVDPNATDIQRSFLLDEQYSLLLRTLRNKKPQSAGGKNEIPVEAVPVTVTPFHAERAILNNRFKDKNIIFTPATLIDPKSNVSLYSSRSQWLRAERRSKTDLAFDSMPSVIYVAAMQGHTDLLGRLDNFKKHFGHVTSFSSKNGFTPAFQEKVESKKYTHAELIDKFGEQPPIQKSLQKHTSLFPAYSTSFKELKERLVTYQQSQGTHPGAREYRAYPDGTLPHNEVVARMWLWDAKGIEIGKEKISGLAATIELQLARKSLALELQEQGVHHPLLKEFILQQISVNADNSSLKKEEVENRYASFSKADKEAVVKSLISKLEEPISPCSYFPEDASIKNLKEINVTATDVTKAIDQVLTTKLGSAASASAASNKLPHLERALTPRHTMAEMKRVFIDPASRSETDDTTRSLALRQTLAARNLLYKPGKALRDEIATAASALQGIVAKLTSEEIDFLTSSQFGSEGFLPGTPPEALHGLLDRLIDGERATATDRAVFISIVMALGDMHFTLSKRNGQDTNPKRMAFLTRFAEIAVEEGLPYLSLEDMHRVRLAGDGVVMGPNKREEQPKETTESKKAKKSSEQFPLRTGVHNVGDRADDLLGIAQEDRIPGVRWAVGQMDEERVSRTSEPFVDHMSGRIAKGALGWDMLCQEKPADIYTGAFDLQERSLAAGSSRHAAAEISPEQTNRRLARLAGISAVLLAGGFHSALEIVESALKYNGQNLRRVLEPEQDAAHLLGEGAATELVCELLNEQSSSPVMHPS